MWIFLLPLRVPLRCHPCDFLPALDGRGDAPPVFTVGKELDARVVVVIITTMGSAELIKKLEADGWLFRRARGSHHVYVHPEKPGHVVVPHPRKDLGKGLAHQIMNAAGLN